MKTFIIISSLLFSSVLYAEELRVNLTCKNGKCSPTVPPARVIFGGDTTNLNARLLRIQKNMGNMNGAAQQDLSNLKKELLALQEQVRGLLGKVHDKTTREELLALSKRIEDIGRLDTDRFVLTRESTHQGFILLSNRLNTLEKRSIHLLLGGFGGVATTYMGTGGLDLTVQLPLGGSKWLLNLSGGLGVSPSKQIGSLLSIVVARRLNRHLSLGPAALHMMDWGNTLTTEKNYVAGGGVELTWKLNHVVGLSVLPFLGVGIGTTHSSINHPAVYKDTLCGSILVNPEYTEQTETSRVPVLTGGVVMRVRYFLL